MGAPWDDPDWYDLHDTTWTAGPEREPEHYRELVIALPPLGPDDHVVDVGTGTGKLARLIAASYPSIGRVTLIEPNVGSVVMPSLMLAGGTLADGLAWTRRALGQCLGMLAPGKPLFLLETLAPPWAAAEAGSGCRRLFLPELVRELEGVGFEDVECVYRFRDRVAVRAARP